MYRNKKTVYAGRLICSAIYPVATGWMPPRERAGKIKATTAAMQRLNFKHSWERLSALLAVNFSRGDDVVTLTYDDEHLPAEKNRKRVENDLKIFRKKASAFWKGHGKPFRMIWSIEHKHGDGRWHVHAVINRLGTNDGRFLAALWGRGDVHIGKLKEASDKNHISLARYMAKESEERENSRHAWHYTKNCRQPETEIERDVGDEPLQAPKGAIVLEAESHRNEYGTWAYIKYYIPEDAPQRTQKLVKNLL